MAWSDEVHGIIRVVTQAGVPHKVKSVCRNRGGTSYHDQQGTGGCGLAVDFAGLVPFNEHRLHRPLLSIFDVLAKHSSRLAELFYSGAHFYVKNGVRYPISQLSPSVRDAHWNHVHVAVRQGTVLLPVTVAAGQGTIGDVDDNGSPKIVAAFPYEDGYVLVADNGSVYCFNCTFRGALRLEGDHFVVA